MYPFSFCDGDEPKSGLARDLGDRLQSRNMPFGTSGDFAASGKEVKVWWKTGNTGQDM